MKSFHKVLVDARNYLAECWVPGDIKSCLVGALYVGTYNTSASSTKGAIEGLSKSMYREELINLNGFLPPLWRYKYPQNAREVLLSCVSFNDSTFTRKEAVLNLLDRAIASTAPEPEDIKLDDPVHEDSENKELELVGV